MGRYLADVAAPVQVQPSPHDATLHPAFPAGQKALVTRPASSAHPKSSLDLVIQWLPECGNQDASRRQITKWRADLSLAMSEVLNDIRPDRMEPRARKRRPKSSSLLTQPRHQFKEIPHREQYRKVA